MAGHFYGLDMGPHAETCYGTASAICSKGFGYNTT
ncbi:hypothetical protein FBZ96_11226 [Bradyrhizobium stylosanthis]|uniref:Uncharacterized protein n=1 Tax=Bradyrhizobium stylosanthis TaxID=1803665 RepID=A0A560D4I7_9BRAD|nr:hypothetical protein FBZ96_11226 [Bradyrhizobium stylosanthis]